MLKFNGIGGQVKPKILINIGGLLDIPTSAIITGNKGETIMNGGLGQVTGIVGAGNNYKSTILHHMMLSAANRISASAATAMTTYDTEVNISLDRLEDMCRKFDFLPNHPITGDEPMWLVTDKTTIPANKWVMGLSDYAKNKEKAKEAQCTFQAFKDPYTKKPLEGLLPTFAEVDSLSEFEAESTEDMLDGDIDDSGTNTFAMKQGLFKTKFFQKMPKLTNSANIHLLMTAQIGKKIDMASGPMAKYQQPTRELQYLKQEDKIKGVSTKFFFLLNNAWMAHTATILKNQTTKLPEYPIDANDVQGTDLNLVRLTQLRSKSGPSGYTIEVIVSQVEGVLPSLTEFHYIKENKRYGISGSNIHYNLDILPEVSLSRTTVRKKIDQDKKLRRAINITADLLQLGVFHSRLEREGLLCTPAELYKDIKDLGYDWDYILSHTRSYWTIDQYDNEVPFLSTIDLLKMRKGEYLPYFLNEDKSIKDKYKVKDIKDGK
jgi:hypothetical protein